MNRLPDFHPVFEWRKPNKHRHGLAFPSYLLSLSFFLLDEGQQGNMAPSKKMSNTEPEIHG